MLLLLNNILTFFQKTWDFKFTYTYAFFDIVNVIRNTGFSYENEVYLDHSWDVSQSYAIVENVSVLNKIGYYSQLYFY